LSSAEKSIPTRDTIKRLLWLLALWAASVLALGVVATLFRLLMTAAGMRTH
jgi:hypothetical protein